MVIDVPKDTTEPSELAPYVYPKAVAMRSYNPARKGNARQVRKALKVMLQAHRPVIYVGGGVIMAEASSQLRELVDSLGYPLTNTLMGLGAYPGDNRNCLGMLGMHGTYQANMAMHEADLIVCLGARFDDRVTNNTAKFSPNATIVHVDVDPASISKIIQADIPIVGDVQLVLSEMLSQLPQLLADEEASSVAQRADHLEKCVGANRNLAFAKRA